MGNIVGEGFPEWLNGQINTRQDILGSIERDNQQLAWINSKTGWCRLVSSVDVKQQLRGIKVDKESSQLAKDFVLFNGTSKYNVNVDNDGRYTGLTSTPRSGIYPGVGDFNNYAYGLGGTEFGLRPMPGITSAVIKTETRGSLKTATIQVKANSREQFDIIDILYLRLGFNMLLEWGNSSYFDNKKTYVSNNPYSLADAFVSKVYKGRKVNYESILGLIKEGREESNGNYDAIVGKVVNFNWTFNRDGSYDITIILRSLGDVIESLKTNILLPFSTLVKENPIADVPPIIGNSSEKVIEEFANSHEIAKDFYYYQKNFEKFPTYQFNSTYGTATVKAENSTKVDYFRQDYDNNETQYYVRFGRLLEIISNKIIPCVSDDSITNIDFIKLLKIDTEINTNILLLGSVYQIPSDPRICIRYSAFADTNTVMANGCEAFYEIYDKKIYGKIMNIYFNMVWVLETMEGLKDRKTGKINLYDILEALCDGWNQSTGNFNQLEPIVDEETNTVKIVDQIPLPESGRKYFLEKQGLPTNAATLQVYSFHASQSNFVRDLSFQTTVPNNLATMITVGSTQNGYTIGQDSTALSRMNNGLQDRFKIKIEQEDIINKVKPPTTSSLEEDYANVIETYNLYIEKLYSKPDSPPTWDTEAMDSFKSIESQLIEYDKAKQTQTALEKEKASATNSNSKNNIASPNTGFLPFDLSLTLDGISGMKIYQSLNIDTSFLPSNYPTSLEFLIKGITHNIQNNTWTTSIETMAIPKNPFGTEDKTISPYKNRRPGVNTSVITGGKTKIIENILYKNGEMPDDKLKLINNYTKYKGDIQSDNGLIRLYTKASIALDKLIEAAEKEGIPVKINSAYRTVTDQNKVWGTNCSNSIGSGRCIAKQGQGPAAIPGTSNHGFGLAVDFATPSLKRIKEGDKLYEWLVKNAASYGFKRIQSETWHWEYQL